MTAAVGAYTWPPSRFRSNWMAVVVHGVEALPGLFVVFAVILAGLSRGEVNFEGRYFTYKDVRVAVEPY